jgi:methionyl-tRNA synthetase
MYVWLDALSNYYTAARENNGELADLAQLGRWPPDLHVIGKDILKFHAVYWPAFLMAAGIEPPKSIVAHGWWTKDGKKISKSFGNYFDPMDKAKEYGHDPLRYFLLRESSCADDPDYSDRNMIARLNGELADTFGNLVMRATSRKINVNEIWPALGTLTEKDHAMIRCINDLPGTADHYFLIPDIQRALIAVFDVIRSLNAYTTENAPWKLVKEDPERLNTVLYIIMEGLRVASILLTPVLPETIPKVLDQLGVPPDLRRGIPAMAFGKMPSGAKIGPLSTEILFPKKEIPTAAGEAKKASTATRTK